MNEPVKLWIEALRSGKYRQGKWVLITKDGRFCCLGLACQLFNEHHARKLKMKLVRGSDDMPDHFAIAGQRSFLPRSVQRWLGLRTRAGSYGSYGYNDTSLSDLNDDGKTFKQIAKKIESNPEGLFR